MKAQMTVVPAPTQIGTEEPQPITARACLNYVKERSAVATTANFLMLAGGVLYLYCEAIWITDRKARKSKDELKANLADALREPVNPNAHAGKSKRYEFVVLCVELARHPEMKALAVEAAKRPSVDSAAIYLTSEFSERASSVAALARYFGTERKSGKHSSGPAKRAFLLRLRALVGQAEKDEEHIPFVESVKVLAPAATQQDVFNLLKQLIPHTTDDALPELIELANRVIQHRRATA